jgi:hypothetical protein
MRFFWIGKVYNLVKKILTAMPASINLCAITRAMATFWLDNHAGQQAFVLLEVSETAWL